MGQEEAPGQPTNKPSQAEKCPHLSLVLPAYNEASRIDLTLTKTISYLNSQPYSWELIVVDDGSSDQTVDLVEAFALEHPNIRIVSVVPNRGKGHALKKGVLQATGYYIGFMDADYKTDITCTSDALEQLDTGIPIVIGSRKLSGTQIDLKPKLYRRLGSFFFNKYIHTLLPILGHYKDTQCGFKFYTHQAAHAIFSRQIIERFMFDAEVLFLAHRLGFQVKEIPVRWSSDHDTRTKIIESIVRNTIDLIRIRKHHRHVEPFDHTPQTGD
ncbi:MAG: glycosyltransferase family 2 protein [Candidatus Latescibacteria bacterium]|jgi:dolichyl-phosphate beta-glucosyltransferase|nr:glycosyltransferase family 2 protein [Candidatus Latescibacterota bacterium]MBT4137118.1 glycosyltransferase family 2 protein [Candidatus Latescibacterota bacterium]